MIDLIKEKMPVSISLGLWMTLITYLISIPLGIRKAVRDERVRHLDLDRARYRLRGAGLSCRRLLLILFAGSSFFQWFPSRGLTVRQLGPALAPRKDRRLLLAHLTLPLIAMSLGAFTTMAFLTKKGFLDEIRKQYVITARAKGLSGRASALWTRVCEMPCFWS